MHFFHDKILQPKVLQQMVKVDNGLLDDLQEVLLQDESPTKSLKPHQHRGTVHEIDSDRYLVVSNTKFNQELVVTTRLQWSQNKKCFRPTFCLRSWSVERLSANSYKKGEEDALETFANLVKKMTTNGKAK
jgi:hypothetical protein